MKNIVLALLACSPALFSCNNNADTPAEKLQQAVSAQTLAPGTLVAIDSMPVVEDKLNVFHFSVKISAAKLINKGHYKVDAAFGPNEGSSELVMPRNDYPLIPVLKRTGEPYTFIVGFYMNDDTAFYDYYKISADELRNITMNYTKGYRFQ
jgi:hypothetical protein